MRNVIDGEKAAISKYQHQISYIRDENITENLRRIILDERLHVEILKCLRSVLFLTALSMAYIGNSDISLLTVHKSSASMS